MASYSDRREKTISDYLKDIRNFIKMYWQWIATVLIIPIVKWGMDKRRSSKKEKLGPSQEKTDDPEASTGASPQAPGGGT